MNPLLSIANRLVLAPTQDPVDPESRQRVPIPCGSDEMEAWVHRQSSMAHWFVLKFPGAGGRAERASTYPAELFSPHSEVWTINPPGYGTSTGKACVSKMHAVAEAAWNAIQEVAAGAPIIVTGTSLGAMYALDVAARFPVAGVLLRHPAPVHQLIQGQHNPRTFGLASRTIGKQIPSEVDAGRNAPNCTVPAFIAIAEHDQIIPAKYQVQLAESYGGDTVIFVLREGKHESLVTECQQDEFNQLAEEWADQVRLHSAV